MPQGIPSSETICLTRITTKGNTYYITSKENSDTYFLYKLENGKATKVAKAPSPTILEEKYIEY